MKCQRNTKLWTHGEMDPHYWWEGPLPVLYTFVLVCLIIHGGQLSLIISIPPWHPPSSSVHMLCHMLCHFHCPSARFIYLSTSLSSVNSSGFKWNLLICALLTIKLRGWSILVNFSGCQDSLLLESKITISTELNGFPVCTWCLARCILPVWGVFVLEIFQKLIVEVNP